MQKLEDNGIMTFNPGTLVEVRRLYNLEKPGQIEKAINTLEDWIQKQPHFKKKNFRREYLERVIIQLKGSVERAKSQLDKLCTLRTMIPRYFAVTNPQKQLKELEGYVVQSPLPKLTEDNYRIYAWKINPGVSHTTRKVFLMYSYCLLMAELLKSEDYCDGVSIVCDMRGVQISEFISQVNLTDLRQFIIIGMEGYDVRLKQVLFLTSSKAINLFINLVKQFLSPKIGGRISVLESVEELYKCVPKDLLPADYGGKEKSLEILNDECLAMMSSTDKIKYWEEMRYAQVDESRRSKCTFDESILGLQGTFRTLNVD